MPRPLPKIGNKEKALIHVAKSKLGLSEDAYREMLASVGVTSSRDLNVLQFEELLGRLEAGGFVSSRAPRSADGKSRKRVKPADGRGPLLRKIRAILADTGLTEEYALGIAAKMGFCATALEWLHPDSLWRVAAALSIYQKRKKTKEGTGNERNV